MGVILNREYDSHKSALIIFVNWSGPSIANITLTVI